MSNLIELKDKFFIAGSKGMVGSAIKRNLINTILIICYKEKKFDKRTEFYKLVEKAGIIMIIKKNF